MMLAATAIFYSIVLGGCGNMPQKSSVAQPFQAAHPIFIGVDRSESTVNFRAQMLDQLDLTADIAADQKTTLEVWAFDRLPLQLYRGTPSAHDDLRDVKRAELAPDANHPRNITRPALLLESWIKERQIHPLLNTYAIMLTDGDSEVDTDQPRLKSAMITLGKDPGFHLAVVGIKPNNRKLWDGYLAIAMPGRYMLADEQNGQSDLAHFLH